MNEKRIENFASILLVVQVLAIIYAVVIIILWFIYGGVWFQETIIPLHATFFFILLLFTFLILIPLMVIKTTRPYSGVALYQLTYLFGGIAWFNSLHYCMYFLGVFWLVVGFLLAGVGVIPVAIIGSMIKEDWRFFWIVGFQLITTFGCRALSAYAVTTSDK